MNQNVHRISDYQTSNAQTSTIFETINCATRALNRETAEVVPLVRPEGDSAELSDDEIDQLWEEAVDHSIAIIDKSDGPGVPLMLIANLVDDLAICGVSTSSILSSVQRGLEMHEERTTAINAEAE
tara:strand:+ start:219 stop:596 length:378 start_codon:yes stop_codon:yes gene_type:complete